VITWVNVILNLFVVMMMFTILTIILLMYKRLSVQHKIRTPVATIKGMAEALIEREDQAELTPAEFRTVLLKTMAQNSEQALRALDDAWLDVPGKEKR
jgi:signal transduction histidine kinase